MINDNAAHVDHKCNGDDDDTDFDAHHRHHHHHCENTEYRACTFSATRALFSAGASSDARVCTQQARTAAPAIAPSALTLAALPESYNGLVELPPILWPRLPLHAAKTDVHWSYDSGDPTTPSKHRWIGVLGPTHSYLYAGSTSDVQEWACRTRYRINGATDENLLEIADQVCQHSVATRCALQWNLVDRIPRRVSSNWYPENSKCALPLWKPCRRRALFYWIPGLTAQLECLSLDLTE